MTQLHSNSTWIAESPSTASPGWNFCPDCESEGALYCHRERVHGPDRRKSTASSDWNFLDIILDLFHILFELLLGED